MEMQRKRRSVVLVITGSLYGILLAIIGLLATGAGHGTLVLIGMSSSPVGFFGIPIALLSPPLLWAIMGWLLSKSERSPYRIIFLVIMAVHYLSLWPLLTREPYGDWEYFDKMWQSWPVIVATGIACYVVGQAVIWLYFLRRQYECRRNRSVNPRAA